MRLPRPRLTIALIVVTVLAWVVVALAGLDQQAAIGGGFIPARFDGGAVEVAVRATAPGFWFVPLWLTPLSATLVHGGLWHVALNMLMLGFCGRFVEAALGRWGLGVLYLLGAYAAALGQYLWDPASLVPMIGASGAASAVVGAYAVLFGQQRATLADRRLNLIVNVAWLAAAWIILQLLLGYTMAQGQRPIAVFAHIGGFLGGMALARPLLLWRFRKA